jgi:predicted AAA+ superfamily ATPase
VLSNIRALVPSADICHYRTSNGAEIDFVVTTESGVSAVECKASYSPVLSKGNFSAIEDISPAHTFVVTPSPMSWSMKKGIDAISLAELKHHFVI